MRFAFCFAAAMLSIDMAASAQKPPSKEPADSRACSVLTKEDAAAALGEPVKGPQASAMAEGPSSCEYSEGHDLLFHRAPAERRPDRAHQSGREEGLRAAEIATRTAVISGWQARFGTPLGNAGYGRRMRH
jgi:hypothetical protein